MLRKLTLVIGCAVLAACSSEGEDKASMETQNLDASATFENSPTTGSQEMVEGTLPSTIASDPNALCVEDCKGMQDEFTWPDAEK